MSVDLSTEIISAAVGPTSATVDGVTVAAAKVTDLIMASKFLSASVAASKAHRGLRFSRLVPPGAVSRCHLPRGHCC